MKPAPLAARLLDMPAERELGSAVQHDYDPAMIKQRIDSVKRSRGGWVTRGLA